MKNPKKPKPFATEAELCAAFIAALEKEPWTSYAETAGWDLLLVRDADGFQIGIQAKLRLNVDVINQALEECGKLGVTSPGPDCRAVLVPDCDTGGLGRIADYIGITIIQMRSRGAWGWQGHGVGYLGTPYTPNLPSEDGPHWSREGWHEWAPVAQHKLPSYVPDVAAGASAPLQLTEWKIAALKLEAILEIRGHLTRADFKVVGIDHRRWLTRGAEWLVKDSRGHLVRGRYFRNFAAQHPKNYAEIVADREQWWPQGADPALAPVQGDLLAKADGTNG